MQEPVAACCLPAGSRPEGRLLRIALIGTRGVPARYGGFETAVEEVGTRLAGRGHHVTVFCRGALDTGQPSFRGMHLVHLPALRHKVAETLSHTALSVLHERARSAQVAIVFNAANAAFVPLLRRAGVPTAVHVDGLEWQRSKWGRVGRRFYLINERLAVRWADALIADAVGIQAYYRGAYGAESTFIPYGAPILSSPRLDLLTQHDVEPFEYHLVVARLEPENHVRLAIQGYLQSHASLPLLVVGDAPYSRDYVGQIRALAAESKSVRLLGSVWDQNELDALYAGAATYIHGHSVGGTNPSLLRAMGAAAPVLAWNVNFNSEVLANHGRFWHDAMSLSRLIQDQEKNPAAARAMGAAGQRRAQLAYTWDGVADQYEQLCMRLLGSHSR